MKSFACALACAMMLTLSAGVASAQDLMGEWTEVENWGARAGASAHKLGDGDTFLTMDNAGFTLKVTEQNEAMDAFHGEWCSKNDCEDVVGVVRSNGDILIVDEDGYFEGTLVGETLELCYLEATADFRVANCRIMTRK